MKRIEVGQILKTNYVTGPYRVVSIERGCTCPHVLDSINHFDEAPPLPPHAHLYLRYTDEAPEHNRGAVAYINYVDEATLKTYGEGGSFTGDRIILCENTQPIQTSLALV